MPGQKFIFSPNNHLDKEEDSVEGERSKETAEEETRFEGEEGEVGSCKEDQVDVGSHLSPQSHIYPKIPMFANIFKL